MLTQLAGKGHIYLLGLLVVASACGEPLLGRAIVASLRGDAHYEWPDGREDLEEGMALTHGHTVITDDDASLCAVLTPGALLCIHEDTELELETLEHVTPGLPGEGKPVERRIVLQLLRGAVLVHAGEESADRSISIGIGRQTEVLSTGGSFMLGATRDARYVYVEEGSVTVDQDGSAEVVEAGTLMTLKPEGSGETARWEQSTEERDDDGLGYDFRVCRRFFRPLAPLTFDWEWGNLAGLGDWIEPAADITFVGVPREWQDVSPSVRRTSTSRYLGSARPPSGPRGGGQRRRPEMWDWYRRVGTLRGVNYIPRTAANPIEMWQEETFDADTIDEELGWAEDVELTSVRVFLPFVVWEADAAGLKNRMDEFLSLADDHALSTVFVLFDDRHAPGTEARVGAQPEPIPGVHNSRWTASPGHELVPEDAGRWPDLKEYVQDVVEAFEGDKRVLLWDAYNEPGHSGVGSNSLPLVEATLDWVREIGPEQPVTAGISATLAEADRIRVAKQCDVVTLADYENADQMRAMLALATTRGRPVICTGWLRRGQKNTFDEILPVFSQFGAGWFHWGLVQGRSQMYMPWDAREGAPEPDVWEQDLLNAEGEPHDEEEIKLIKGFSFDAL